MEVENGVIREFKSADRETWDQFVSGAPNGNLLQSWGWGDFKRGHGWHPVRLGLVVGGELRAAAQVLFRSMFGLSMAYVPRGPVATIERPAEYTHLLDALHKLARDRHSIMLKVEPNEARSESLDSFLRFRGFVKSGHTPQSRATLYLDINGGEDEVLARIGRKTRYNVRLAEKRGVTVRPACGDEDLRRFYELTVETGQRGGFPIHSLEYYSDVLAEFRARNQAELFLAEAQGDLVAAAMVFAYGHDGVYLYGASTDKHRRDKPTYLLQWRSIQWCMQRGCSRYDLWGIPERAAINAITNEVPDDQLPDSGGLWGVYRFKQSFGDTPIHFAGAYDYPYVKPLYLAWSRMRQTQET